MLDISGALRSPRDPPQRADGGIGRRLPLEGCGLHEGESCDRASPVPGVQVQGVSVRHHQRKVQCGVSQAETYTRNHGKVGVKEGGTVAREVQCGVSQVETYTRNHGKVGVKEGGTVAREVQCGVSQAETYTRNHGKVGMNV